VVAKQVEDLKFLVVLMADDVPMDPGLRYTAGARRGRGGPRSRASVVQPTPA